MVVLTDRLVTKGGSSFILWPSLSTSHQVFKVIALIRCHWLDISRLVATDAGSFTNLICSKIIPYRGQLGLFLSGEAVRDGRCLNRRHKGLSQTLVLALRRRLKVWSDATVGTMAILTLKILRDHRLLHRLAITFLA